MVKIGTPNFEVKRITDPEGIVFWRVIVDDREHNTGAIWNCDTVAEAVAFIKGWYQHDEALEGGTR